MPLYMIKRTDPTSAPYITYLNVPIAPGRIRLYLKSNGFDPISYRDLCEFLAEIKDGHAYLHLPDFYGEPTIDWESAKARTRLSGYTSLLVRHILVIIQSEQDMERQRRWTARRVDGRPLDPSEDIKGSTDISPGFEDKLIDWLYFSNLILTLSPQQQQLFYDYIMLEMPITQLAKKENVTRQSITERILHLSKRIERTAVLFKEDDDRL